MSRTPSSGPSFRPSGGFVEKGGGAPAPFSRETLASARPSARQSLAAKRGTALRPSLARQADEAVAGLAVGPRRLQSARVRQGGGLARAAQVLVLVAPCASAEAKSANPPRPPGDTHTGTGRHGRTTSKRPWGRRGKGGQAGTSGPLVREIIPKPGGKVSVRTGLRGRRALLGGRGGPVLHSSVAGRKPEKRVIFQLSLPALLSTMSSGTCSPGRTNSGPRLPRRFASAA